MCLTALYATTTHALNDPVCDAIANNNRFDCYPEQGSTQAGCLSRNCCWQPPHADENGQVSLDIPYCFFPSNFPNYRIVNSSRTQSGGLVYSIQKSTPTFRPNDILNLEVNIIPETQQRLRVQIIDPANDRYQVPVVKKQAITSSSTTATNFASDEYDYQTTVSNDPFSLKVFRKSTGKLM